MKETEKIIAIVGLTGSGKSVATEFFEEKGFAKVRFGQITMDTLRERGLEVNEKNEREIRESLRKELGMGAYAIKNIPKIEALLSEKKDVVLDGLYSWSEYKILKERFKGQLKILAIQTPPSLRYERLGSRDVRPLNADEAASRDYSEIENIEKAGPIAMADFTVTNDGNLDELKKSLENVYCDVKGIAKESLKETCCETCITETQIIKQDQKHEQMHSKNSGKGKQHIRPGKVDYYLDIAKAVSRRSTCLRRRFGAVIVTKTDKIISTGYNGAIRKAKDCTEIGKCMREALGIPPGQRYELCKSFHAEQNAIMGADPVERRGATIYLYGEMADGTPSYCEPCMMCKRAIVQAELGKVIGRQPDNTIKEWDVGEFVMEENVGKNFPEEIKKSKEFKEYVKNLK